MKNINLIVSAATLCMILLAGCGGGGGGGNTKPSGMGSFSATANTTAQSLTVGRPMPSFTPIVPSGGIAPYTYSSSALPAGLSYSPTTGAVTGTPTATATANVVFSVQDANKAIASTTSTVLFTVGAASATITATANTTAQNLTAGIAMASFTPLTASGGAWPYTFSYTGLLPSGLSFDAFTGAVSGTPAMAYATAGLVFSVKDANGVAAIITSSVNFTVTAAPVAATDQDAFNAGYAAYVAKDYAGAGAKLDAMIRTYPASTLLHAAYFYLGKSLYHLNDLVGAIAKFDTVLTTYPASAFAGDALLWKGKSLQRQAKAKLVAGDTAGAATLFAAARTLYLQVIALYPTHVPDLVPDSRYQIALSYYDEKNYATALPLFQVVLTNYPTSAIADGAQYHLARTIHALALAATPNYTYAQARTEYGKVFTYTTSIWLDNAQYQIGKTYYDELNYTAAIVEFDKVFANYPASTIADAVQYYKGRSIHALALAALALPPPQAYTMAQARAEYAKVMTNYPLSILADNAQYQIGKTYYDESNFIAAITEFNNLLLNYPLSNFADGGQYHIARSIHALALAATPNYTYAQARIEYATVLSKYPASIYLDNAAYYSALTYHDSTQCTSELAALQAFVLAYPGSPYVATANTHIADLLLMPHVTHTVCIP